MGEDEEGTLAALTSHRRELLDPKIAEHRGRIVKTTGDGALVEFASVVDAVRCAVEVQRGMIERNAGVAPDKRIDFRIGINVGDIILQGDDIFGDGVNVAARLEGLAEPCGICVSSVVRDQVQDKLAFAFVDMGEQTVKNIARPVHAFRVTTNGIVRAAIATRRRPLWIAAGAAAIAVVAAGAWLMGGESGTPIRFDAAKVRAVAERNAIPLPAQFALAPAKGLPQNLTLYLGAWGGDAKWGGEGRPGMLIVTSVDAAGAASGIYAQGPLTPTSFGQGAARYWAVSGKIDGSGFVFNLPASRMVFVATSDNTMVGQAQRNDGRKPQITMSRIE